MQKVTKQVCAKTHKKHLWTQPSWENMESAPTHWPHQIVTQTIKDIPLFALQEQPAIQRLSF